MNDLASDIGLLKRQFRDVHSMVSRLDRQPQRPNHPSPQHLLAKTLACYLLSRKRRQPPAAIAAEAYGNDRDVLQALSTPGMIGKSAMTPAMTTVAGWAAELVTPGGLDFWQVLAPNSIYSQLSQRPGSIRVDLTGRGSVKVPTRQPTPTLSAPFVGEGAPIAVRQMGVSVASLVPRKASVISEFTEETMKHSMPSIETVIRATMSYDAAVSIDGVLLGSTAATAIAPPGLLAGVTPTTAAAGGGIAAFSADVRALALAIEASGAMYDPVLLMSSTSRLLLDVLALGGAEDIPIISSPNVPAKQLIMLDAGNFASAEGDEPNISTTNEVTLHEEDTAPLPISTPGSPATIAAPVRSTFQTATIAIRLLQDLSWVVTRAKRSRIRQQCDVVRCSDDNHHT